MAGARCGGVEQCAALHVARTVRWPITSCFAICELLSPHRTRTATSRSRAVKPSTGPRRSRRSSRALWIAVFGPSILPASSARWNPADPRTLRALGTRQPDRVGHHRRLRSGPMRRRRQFPRHRPHAVAVAGAARTHERRPRNNCHQRALRKNMTSDGRSALTVCQCTICRFFRVDTSTNAMPARSNASEVERGQSRRRRRAHVYWASV